MHDYIIYGKLHEKTVEQKEGTHTTAVWAEMKTSKKMREKPPLFLYAPFRIISTLQYLVKLIIAILLSGILIKGAEIVLTL